MSKIPFLRLRKAAPLVVTLTLQGAIGAQSRLGKGLDLARVEQTLAQAFAIKNAVAVAITVNSPGGSPVQAALIHDRIRALSAEKKRPVYMFAEDVAASGGYMLLLAGDEIYAHPASILGSIGVISGGFGFHEALRKLGVERRLHTTGPRKGMLDPFLPEQPEDVERLKVIQTQIHDFFKLMVEHRRPGKLKGEREILFSGDIWLGERAMELGLIDGLGDLRTVMKGKFGDKTRFKALGRERRKLLSMFGFGSSVDNVADAVADSLETRALWSRFGL